MNEYNFNVKFEKGRISSNLKKLVQNDYNSTKINFTFDKEGRKLFKMLYPDETAYITQIDNDELMFGPGVLSQDGTYEVEIAVYTEDGRLTDYATTKFDVRAELIQSDEIVELDDRLPILDSLIGDVQGAKTGIEDAIQYATEQGDYAKEQANRNFDAIEEATKIVDNFEKNVINGIDAFNTNATTKLNEYNTNSSNKLEEFNSNATKKIEEYNANADNLISIAIDTRNELERVKNDILETGEANGNYLTLNDSTMAELQELEVNSVEKQVTTTGKNLLPRTTKTTQTINGITFTINNDGTITANGTATVQTKLYSHDNFILKTGTYKFKDFVNNESYDSYFMYIEGPSVYSYSEKTFTVDNDTSVKVLIMVREGKTVNNVVFKPMISENGGDWEPYTGGTASPNPDYPQEIPMITTDSVLKSVGKNLFDKDNANIGKFTISTSSSSYGKINSSENSKMLYVKIEKNTTYMVSKILSSRFIIGTSSEIPAVGVVCNSVFTFNEYTSATITTGSDDIYLYVYYYLKTQDSVTEQEILDSIQIEEGSTATEYEPYQETILNLPIPEGEFVGYINDNAKDTLRVAYNEEDGVYHLYLDKMLGKVVLDENRELTYHSVKNEVYQFRCPVSDMKSEANQEKVIVKASHFKGVKWHNSWLEDNVIANWANNSALMFYSSKFVTVEEFKTWLSTNNVTAIYALANPYTLDLGMVDMPLSYDGTTNIFVDTDLLMNINAKYYRNFTETIRNLQINNDTLKNELVSIESRLSASSGVGKEEIDPTVPTYVKSIKETDIEKWNSKATIEDMTTYIEEHKDELKGEDGVSEEYVNQAIQNALGTISLQLSELTSVEEVE